MKQIIITLFLSLCAVSSWAQEDSFTLTLPINVPLWEGKQAFLADFTEKTPTESNSICALIENGRIVFSGSVSHPTMKMLFIEKKKICGILIEHGEIMTDSRWKDFTGSPLNNAFTEFKKENSRLKDSLDSFQNRLKAFVKKHNNDLAGMMALSTYQDRISVEDRLALVSECGEVIKENPAIKKDIELWENEYTTRPGQKYVNIELTAEDSTQKLSDYVGKGHYVLVNFWTPWCPFSREEIPNLIKIFDEYKDKGLIMLGIACGNMKESKLVIDEFSIPYPQLFTCKSGVESLYGIDKFPEIILFSPDGTIVDRWLRGEALTTLLERIL